MENQNWSEKQKFWYETFRTSIFAFFAICFTYFISNKWESTNKYESELESKKLEIRWKVIDEFLVDSYNYTALLYDGIEDYDTTLSISQNVKIKKINLEKIQGEAFVKNNNSANRLREYFYDDEELLKLMKKSDTLQKKLYCKIKAKMKTPKEPTLAYNKLKIERETLRDNNNKIAQKAIKKLQLENESTANDSFWCRFLGFFSPKCCGNH